MAAKGNDRFATDPTGRLAAGPPGGRGSSGLGSFSVGRVGSPMRDVSRAPGETVGSGYGASFSMPIGKKLIKSKAKGGKVKKMAKGGSTASKRGDGCATKGKTKGRFV